MTGSRQDASEWSMRPLCRRYHLGVFDGADLRWSGGDAALTHRVIWAFGWLADGECEPLGVWVERASEEPCCLVAELKVRGVERIWRVAGTATAQTLMGVATAFSTAKVSPSIDQAVTTEIAAANGLGMPTPRAFAEQVHDGVTRACRRAGRFDDDVAALALVAGVLQRAERRLDRDRLATIERRGLPVGGNAGAGHRTTP